MTATRVMWSFCVCVKSFDVGFNILILILSQGLYLGLDYRIIGKSMFLCGLQFKLQVHVV